MGIIHEILYRSGSLTHLNLAEYMEELSEYVRLTHMRNGRGMEGEFEWEAAESVGFTIVRELTKQLSAEVETYFRDGFRFTIRFQRSESRGAGSGMLEEEADKTTWEASS